LLMRASLSDGLQCQGRIVRASLGIPAAESGSGSPVPELGFYIADHISHVN
jgi:hypothetical protein